jgi:hypothetical protein
MYTYFELPEDLKVEARKLHPTDFTEWSYQVQGVEIAFSCQ